MRIEFKIIIGFIIVVGLIIYWFLTGVTDAFSATYQRVELVSDKNEKLYIRTKNWGVTGDKQLTIITTEDGSGFEADSTKQIIFEGLEPFLYKTSNDTLVLIVRQKSKIPTDLKTHWTIIQKEVNQRTKKNLRRDIEYKQM